ncbi:hypothetical protein [Streptomyces sp. NPDC056227]|uniref:hypothetical protein n=1 Tax=Streptomyces sp. NPDC056227 TaxID=3345753 RepID=UPI0035E06C86
MTDVHSSVLAALDAASSASYPSHSIVAEGLAVAADRENWPEAEIRHLEALRAALLFFTRPDGTFHGEYQVKRRLLRDPARGPLASGPV